jgi:[ribosomal protein S5]-alanine N-acetyltransferase
MNLVGRRCTLRDWRKSDEASIVGHANNLNIARQLRDRFPHPYTRDDARTFLKAAASGTPRTNFAIDVAGEAVGGLGYVPGGDVERYSAEVGYWLAEPFWNRGIITEALGLFTRYAFTELNLLRLFAVPLADNPGSIRVLEKAGYVREGILRASCVKYGQAKDQVLYAAVNPAWRG